MDKIVTNNKVQIELKKVKVSSFASHETTCYQAEVWVDGVKAFMAENDGQGGADLYTPFNPAGRAIIEKCEAYAKSLPNMPSEYFPDGLEMNLELLIGDLLADWEKQKIAAKIMRDAVKHTTFALPGDAAGEYRYIKAPRTAETDAFVMRKYPNAVILKPEEVKV